MRRNVYVLGGEHSPFVGKFHPDFIWKKHPDYGKRDNPTLEEHLHRALLGALEACGVPAEAVERGYVGNFCGELFASQGHLGSVAVAAAPGFSGKPFVRVEGACASGGLAVAGAVDAIRLGCDVVIAAGAEVQTTVNAKVGADYLARAADYARQRDYDPFTFPALFGKRTRAYFEAHGVGHEDLAHVAVKAYGNANRNPYAHMKARSITFDWAAAPSEYNPCFLSNEEVRDYLKVSDCSQVSDGASAVVLASDEGLEKLGRKPEDAVRLVGCAVSTGPLGDPDDLPTPVGIARGLPLVGSADG